MDAVWAQGFVRGSVCGVRGGDWVGVLCFCEVGSCCRFISEFGVFGSLISFEQGQRFVVGVCVCAALRAHAAGGAPFYALASFLSFG
jgi:hypothetical protein